MLKGYESLMPSIIDNLQVGHELRDHRVRRRVIVCCRHWRPSRYTRNQQRCNARSIVDVKRSYSSSREVLFAKFLCPIANAKRKKAEKKTHDCNLSGVGKKGRRGRLGYSATICRGGIPGLSEDRWTSVGCSDSAVLWRSRWMNSLRTLISFGDA